MSRRSKSRYTRDVSNIANRSRLGYRITPLSTYLSEYDDRRRFHPLGDRRPIRSFDRFVSPRRVVSPNPRVRVPTAVAFANPRKVFLCVRRKIRREVMFAKGGAGSRKMRRPKRNQHSNVRC